MIEAENNIVRCVDKSLEEIDNLAVNNALKGIALDSNKHADLYRSAITILTQQRSALNEKQLENQKEIIKKHIAMEERLIDKLKKMMPQMTNEKVKFILQVIFTDEKKHHKLLLRVQELLVKGETVTEEEWWDAIWGDVPGLWV